MDLETLYHECYNNVYQFVKKEKWSNIDSYDVSEIVNDAIIKAYQKTDEKYEKTSFECYAKGFAYHIMMNYSTKKSRYYHKNTELLEKHYNLYKVKNVSLLAKSDIILFMNL